MSAHRSSKTQIRNASKCQEFWMNKIVRGRELTFRHAAHLKSKYLHRDLRANTNIIICFFFLQACHQQQLRILTVTLCSSISITDRSPHLPPFTLRSTPNTNSVNSAFPLLWVLLIFQMLIFFLSSIIIYHQYIIFNTGQTDTHNRTNGRTN